MLGTLQFFVYSNLQLEDLKSLKHKQIESIITLTSSRGVAKTGLSLKSTSVGIDRFDDLLPVQSRYSTINKYVEYWRQPFKSDFTQLAGRIACLGSDPSENNKRCVILARASKITDGPEQIDWLQCLNIFESIPSINISNVYFTSYNAKTSIKHDPVYENSGSFKDKIIELTKNEFIQNMLEHLNIMKVNDNVKEINDNGKVKNTHIADSPIVTANDEDLFFHFENKIRTETENLVNKVKQNGLKNIKIIWSTNSSHLFGCSNDKTIIKFLETQTENYNAENENFDAAAFEEDLLKKWVEGRIDLSIPKECHKAKSGAKRKRTPRISISVERAIYNSFKEELDGSFTAIKLLEFKKHLKSKIKDW